MDKPISHMMAETVWTVDTEDTVEKVDTLLTSHRLSAVPVVDAKGVTFGIISSLDLLHFHAAKKNPKAVRAWELCTYRPIAVSPETSVAEVAKLMIKNRIHHILITENGTVRGIVSALDFVEQYVLKGGIKP
jgi:signal-transduction protein with cAMP-binding, CBS, and nucleotidyltransferase domain